MKTFVRRLSVTAAAVALATAAFPGIAHADTHSTTCSNHNTQAAFTSGPAAIVCFQGTGQSWSGLMPDVRSIWSGPYTVVAGQNGTDNPIEVPPRTTYALSTHIYIQWVQLF